MSQRVYGIVWLVWLVLLSTDLARGEDLPTWLDSNMADLVQVYQHFHQHPELSFHEEQTAARLALELKQAGFETTTGVGGHGVVALLKNGDGPTVMFRSDLDALPVTEETGLAYASKVTTKNDEGATVGVMHACGHDIHITNLIAIARYMATHFGGLSAAGRAANGPAASSATRNRMKMSMNPRVVSPSMSSSDHRCGNEFGQHIRSLSMNPSRLLASSAKSDNISG